MTTLGFDEHDESYIEDAYDDFLPPAIYRCIKAEAKWDSQIDLTPSLEILTAFEQQIEAICQQMPDEHDRLDKLLDSFYSEWLFSASSLKVPEYKLNSISYTLSMRSGTPTTLAILLCHFLQHAKLDASVSITQGEVGIHVAMSDEEGYLVDPSSGQQSWYIIPENIDEENPQEQEPLELIFEDEVYKLFLAQQKWSFISENKFGHALTCVDLLMEILGDDPYERRDRGYLLNQLGCPKMARDDLQFFVDECPDDPAIEIILHQIEELEDNHKTHH
ncbi:tetratricopeptide repeat protein [Pseudoalteromonas sp. SCSIO 43095]|uniref:tetratricopeptide repeat protein n=1 Tax=Pseudoalteromonas TaxID=53246 RepID=UPI00044C877C|nr:MULTISPECIES: tetratricopeptide repeat protein [Pseudoalteromonas]EWS97908.1 transcriptional regulator [Pseudoalteromonas sp. SCSIO_11900]MBT2152891.1 tetratricopeptide repeat protein [Pseudoalteromonas tetraodonis]MCK8137573.1 tetratricopeptide repeat protein [Pseudoalteromonas sp. 2CM28B]URQ99574.1 tetratricopeptide repeat protein [Pseudoalteromonas sp. SCSIO 43095]